MSFITVAGSVAKIVYQSEDFWVFGFDIKDPNHPNVHCTAKGSLQGLQSISWGVTLKLTGQWKNHPKFGKQLAIQSWEPWAATSRDVGEFFQVCLGMHWAIAKRLADKGPAVFSDVSGSLSELEKEPNPVVSPVLIQEALDSWERAVAVRDLSSLLRVGGISSAEIQAALSKFGMEAPQVIKANPYRLLEVIKDFPRVDKMAVELGFKPNSPERSSGAILWALRESLLEGHLYLRRGDLGQEVEVLFRRHSLLPLGSNSLDEATDKLAEQKAVVLEPGTGVYLPEYYKYERASAELVSALLTPSSIQIDVPAFLSSYEKANSIQLSESQRLAVESLTKHRVLVLTGLPGTGKSTAVRALVRLFQDSSLSFALMAPTGIAAKRLSAITGEPASTIHRALRYDGMKWGFCADNKFIVDAVTVDEVSMVDMELFYRLLSALRSDTIVVLVGDDAQLPSVGPGNVLRELVACSNVPNIRLTQIFRQSEQGEIVSNSHRINQGDYPILAKASDSSEFRFVPLSDEARIADLIVAMAAKLKARDANFQVLSPMYRGEVGVDNLNEKLRECLNPPGPKDWRQGDEYYRVGDRVMVTQNDYALGVYNGDMGKLVDIEEKELCIRIHGDPDFEISLPMHLSSRIKLAYAISIHKCQGAEFNTIIVPIVASQGRMLQRNLLYTAVTRARERVWLIGDESAIQQAVQNNKVISRNTKLAQAVGVERH
jgi:exodeoxyribonuclease V alpha subunit